MENSSLQKLKQEAASENTSSERLAELANISDELAEIVASNVTAPPELLTKLADRDLNAVKKAVTSNPNTSAETFLKLGKDYPQEFFNNPILEILFFENPNFAKDIPQGTLYVLLGQQNIPKSLLQSIVNSTENDIAEIAKLHVKYAGEMTEGWHEATKKTVKKLFYHYQYLAEDYNFLGDFSGFLSPHILNYREYQLCLAYNHRTPVNILEEIALDGDRKVCSLLAKNKNVSATILELLATNKYALVRQNVAENLSTPETILYRLSLDENNLVRHSVASNINAPASILYIFANQQKYSYYLAKNTNTPVDILEKIASDENERVRANVASNINTPINILEQLSTYNNNLVCKGLFKNPKTPNYLLSKLANNKRYQTDENLAKNPNTPLVILEKLAINQDYRVRASVATNPNLPITILEQLAIDKHFRVCLGAIANPNITITILERLSTEKDSSIRQAVAKNPNTSINILDQLAIDKHYRVRQAIATNPNTPTTILKQLATDRDYVVRKSVAENNNTPADTLKQLITYEESDIDLAIARNPQCTLEIKKIIFNKFIKTNQGDVLRFTVLMSDYAEREDLAANYNSTSWLERYAVAQNKKTPLETLKALAQDCNRIVRATAKESLEKCQS